MNKKLFFSLGIVLSAFSLLAVTTSAEKTTSTTGTVTTAEKVLIPETEKTTNSTTENTINATTESVEVPKETVPQVPTTPAPPKAPVVEKQQEVTLNLNDFLTIYKQASAILSHDKDYEASIHLEKLKNFHFKNLPFHQLKDALIENKLAFTQGDVNELTAELKITLSNIKKADNKVGWVKEGYQTYYYDENHQKVKGWLHLNNKWYYLSEQDGAMATSWNKIWNSMFFFNQDGTMKTGWYHEGSTWYYFDNNGYMATGWKKIGGYWFHFTSKGHMQTGWLQLGNKWYYFNGSGFMQTGWTTIGGYSFFFNGDGSMKTGWYHEGSKWYHFRNDGFMAKGWRQIGGYWFYFNQDGNMRTGWLQLGNKWYYLRNDGFMLKGWNTIGGYTFFFNSDGTMKTGWLKSGNDWYHFRNDGFMQKGWLTLGNKTYYLLNSGKMVTGKQVINGTVYNFKSSGELITVDPDAIWKNPYGVQPSLKGRKNLSIEVSISKQRIYFYEGSKKIYETICSTGVPGLETPKGRFNIQAEKGYQFGGVFGGARYYTSFYKHGTYLFHTVPIDGAGNYIPSEGRKLGSKASHGCIRMPIPDAIWFYNQVPYNTPVHIY